MIREYCIAYQKKKNLNIFFSTCHIIQCFSQLSAFVLDILYMTLDPESAHPLQHIYEHIYMYFSGCTQLQRMTASLLLQPTPPGPTRLSRVPATPCSPSSRISLSAIFPRIVSITAREQCLKPTASSHLRQRTEHLRGGLSPQCSKPETAAAPAASLI